MYSIVLGSKETGPKSTVEIAVGTYMWQHLLGKSIASCFNDLLYKSNSLADYNYKW